MRKLWCVLVLFSTIACGSSPTAPSSPTPLPPATPTPTPTPTVSVSAVTVAGTAPSVGATAQFSASARLADGTTLTVTSQAIWNSSSPSVASITSGGLVTGIGAGEAEISAVYQGVAGMAHLSVMPPIVTPPSCSFVLSIGSSIEGYPNGGSFDVTVTAPNGCAWSVVSTASWIHVPASIVGSGTGMFAFTVDANTGTARTATLVIAGRTVTFNQTAPPPPPPAPQPTFAGIRYDNIQLAHSFIVGSPVPTQNQAATYCCWPLPVTRSGSFTFNLADYPLNVLPSGGSSNIASASEMMFAAINVSPASTVITFQWHKAVNQDTVIYAYSTGSAYAWAYSFIGHFSWEISEPGAYYLIIGTLSGSARMDFVVTGPSSTLTARQGGRPPITVLSGFEGGGGGAGRD